MVDEILNETLSEKVSTTGVTQENPQPPRPNSLYSQKQIHTLFTNTKQYYEIFDWLHVSISLKEENSPTG